MAHSITEDGLRHYCNEIKSHAIAVCQISNDFTFEPIRQGDNVNMDFQLKDKMKWPCIRQILSSWILFQSQRNHYLKLLYPKLIRGLIINEFTCRQCLYK